MYSTTIRWLRGPAPLLMQLVNTRRWLASGLGNALLGLPLPLLPWIGDVESGCAVGRITLIVPAQLNGALQIETAFTGFVQSQAGPVTYHIYNVHI